MVVTQVGYITALVTLSSLIPVNAAEPVVFWFNVGKSAATATVRAPVPVVVFKIPVPRADVPAE